MTLAKYANTRMKCMSTKKCEKGWNAYKVKENKRRYIL